MHSTEELKRQLDQAESAFSVAKDRRRAAQQKYDAAICAEKMAEFESQGGKVGITRVRVGGWSRQSNVPDMSRGPFLVLGATVKYFRPAFILAKIKKDGTPSSAACAEYPAKVFIIAEDQP